MSSSVEISKKIRKIVLETALKAGAKSAHIGGALSIADVYAVMYSKSFLKFDNNNPIWENRDRLIVSKGHSCLAYYALLHLMGFVNKDDLDNFESDGAVLLGHPVKNMSKGIEFSTGSLGIGISIAIGVAISIKKKSNNSKVFAIVGDGETNEGSVWEAIMSAPNLKVNNLTVIIDKNNLQQTGQTSKIMKNENLAKKLENFGWKTFDIDGHNHMQIEEALKYESETPKAIIANTTKGKGFSFSEDNNAWHHSVLSKKIFDEAIKEVDDNGN